MTPSGASTGEGEALELRDGDAKRFLGKGVLKAIENIRTVIAPKLVGQTLNLAEGQVECDRILNSLDGTPYKSKLGANAILPVSMALARAQADAQGIWLFEHLGRLAGNKTWRLPVPLMNILNGGKHADNGLAIQEFMIVPAGFSKFSDALRAGAEVFHQLKKILHDRGLSTAVGDEGGFAPQFSGENPHTQVLECMMQAIAKAGYEPGKQIFLALDAAASEFTVKGAAKITYDFEGKHLSSSEMIGVYAAWAEKYPFISIEDGLAENDWAGWIELTQKMGGRCQLVGDDLFVTNVEYLKKGIEQKAANAILIKLNQIGSVSETLDTIRLAHGSDYRSVSSHRSGETEDTFIADLAVGANCGQIKTGSASRTDRIAKYNQLLRIEEFLGARATYAGMGAFARRG